MLNSRASLSFRLGIIYVYLLTPFHICAKILPAAAISSTAFLHTQTNTLAPLLAAMDLPADLLPVHFCPHCEKYILDPSADGQPDIQIHRRSWKAFEPELTIGKLRELGQHGCLFGESVYSDLTRYESPSDSPGPLDSRAWALQENLLSARILDYEDNHTTWRCSTMNNVTDGWLSMLEFLHMLGFVSVPEVLRPRSAIKATDETEHRDERQELFQQ